MCIYRHIYIYLSVEWPSKECHTTTRESARLHADGDALAPVGSLPHHVCQNACGHTRICGCVAILFCK